MEARRVLAGVLLALPQTKQLPHGVSVTLPVDRLAHSVNVGVNTSFCRFTFKGVVKDVTLKYIISYRTTRQGSRVEPPLHLGLRLNNKLEVSQLAQEPFYINPTYSGIQGTLTLQKEFKYGDNLDVIIINEGLSCDCDFQSVVINMFDGAPFLGSGGCTSAYVHEQSVPTTTWNVIHNLGFYPNVTTVDSLKQEWEGVVTYLDKDSLKIEFIQPFSGKGYLS